MKIENLKLKIGATKFRIYNSLAQMVREVEVLIKENTGSINTLDLENGVYVLRLKLPEGELSKRFVISR